MPQYIYKKKLLEIFEAFSNEKDPKTNKLKRTEKSIKNVYKYRIEEFIERQLGKEENYQLELMEITNEHVNSFLASVKSDLNMYSRVLKSFFTYTYRQGYTQDISLGIQNKVEIAKPISFISEEHCKTIATFIDDSENDFEDRLLIALFYYTGLKLQVLCNLTNSSFTDGYSIMWFNGRKVPVKTTLQKLLFDNYQRLKQLNEFVNPDLKIIAYAESTTVTNKIKTLSKKITGFAYPPTSYEKTFKKRALKIDCNPFLIAKLTLSEVSSVAKYIDEDVSISKQKLLIESIY